MLTYRIELHAEGGATVEFGFNKDLRERPDMGGVGCLLVGMAAENEAAAAHLLIRSIVNTLRRKAPNGDPLPIDYPDSAART